MSTPSAQDDELDASIYPIAVLLDELKHEEIALRINATRRIKTIAEALGPERTRAELLPFITETIDDDDEVLLSLAEELGSFVAEVGGTTHAYVLLQPLETLSTVEETVVRDKAVESLCKISAHVAKISKADTSALHVDHMYPLLQRLSSGDWFTSRISACSLFADVYRRLPNRRSDLRSEVLKLYKKLTRDETPMVRRAAAGNIANVANSVHSIAPHLVRPELFPVFADLVQDEQDSVRLLIVENASVFAGYLSPQTNSESTDADMSSETNDTTTHQSEAQLHQGANTANSNGAEDSSHVAPTENGPTPTRSSSFSIVDMIRLLAVDKSWRVRYMVADQLGDLCDALGANATRNDLLSAFVLVLKDTEPEVRTAAAFKVTELVKRIVALPHVRGENSGLELVVRQILPVMELLITDCSQHVRAALASNIMGLAPVLGVDLTMGHLVDVVLALLKDEYPEVRLNVIARLDKVSFIMSIEKLSSELLPAIVDLAEDKNWRVRLAIIQHIPLLAKQLGKDFFENNSKLGDLCISWLGDCVFSIREAAIGNLKALTEIFGLEWAKEHIVPQVMEMYDQSGNYLLRMTSLRAIGVLSEVVGSETVENSFLPIVTERASRDPVPNVRFCSAKTLNIVIPFVRRDVREAKIRPCLMSLVDATEKDKDVNYFAQQALLKL